MSDHFEALVSLVLLKEEEVNFDCETRDVKNKALWVDFKDESSKI